MWARVVNRSSPRMLRARASAVRSAMTSASATCRLVNPRATRAATSRSRRAASSPK